MDRFRERDTRFPGSQQDWESTQSIEVARQPPVHFHSPAYLIYETKKLLAVRMKESQESKRIGRADFLKSR